MSYSTQIGSKKIPELRPEEEDTFLGQIKVPGISLDFNYILRSFNFSVPTLYRGNLKNTKEIRRISILKLTIKNKCLNNFWRNNNVFPIQIQQT